MYFEDFEVGLVINTEPKKVTKKEIINFAKSYDPQTFHIDEKLAKKGPFGRLVSSGFMTLGKSFTQFFETGVATHNGDAHILKHEKLYSTFAEAMAF